MVLLPLWAHSSFSSSIYREARNGAHWTLSRQQGGTELEQTLTSHGEGVGPLAGQYVLSSTPFLWVAGIYQS